MKITNTSQAPQGIEIIEGENEGVPVLGRFWLQPGQTRDLEVDEKWAKRNGGRGLLAIEGFTPENQSRVITAEQLNDSGSADLQRAQLQLNELDEKLITVNAENARLQNELTTSAAKISELQNQITDLTAERDDLKSQLGASDTTETEVDPKYKGLTVRHKGGGHYSIFNSADEELVKGLTKDSADEWALKSDEDQLAYVKGLVEANG